MFTVNTIPETINTTFTNTTINYNSISENYIKKINDILNNNNMYMPMTELIIKNIEYLPEKRQLLSHIEKMLIDYLKPYLLIRQSSLMDQKDYTITMQLNDYTKQVAIIEKEMINYVYKFPYSIKNSLYYKGIVTSINESLDYIEEKINTNNKKTNSLLTNLIELVNLIKEKNSLLEHKNKLEKNLNKLIGYNNSKAVINNIVGFLSEIFFSDNIKVAVFFPEIYDKINFLLYQQYPACTDHAKDYKEQCRIYSVQIDAGNKKKERINLTNEIYNTVYSIDKKNLNEVYNLKEKIKKLTQLIKQNITF